MSEQLVPYEPTDSEFIREEAPLLPEDPTLCYSIEGAEWGRGDHTRSLIDVLRAEKSAREGFTLERCKESWKALPR